MAKKGVVLKGKTKASARSLALASLLSQMQRKVPESMASALMSSKASQEAFRMQSQWRSAVAANFRVVELE